MFSPIEKEYYKALNSSIYNDIKVKPGIDNFSVQTKELISELISLFIESERCYEKWRNQFYKLQHFTAKYIFDKFDTFGKNYISSFDVINLFIRLKETLILLKYFIILRIFN